MRILYLSCHSVLEYDEVLLLTELGHEVFSPGAYVEPDNPGDTSLRPSIPNLKYDPEIKEQWHRDIAAKHLGQDGKDYLTKEFVDNFDAVIVMHLPRWIQNNWHVMKHKRVIWRTIGQSISSTEGSLVSYHKQGMEIVRYSPMETNIPGYIGQNALIPFYKDPNIYTGWVGETPRIITFAQSMQKRGQACNFDLFRQSTSSLPATLYGPENESAGVLNGGKLSYKDQIIQLRENRCYFYTGTHPASYTLNFIEAFMTGIPIVAIGPKYGNASYFKNHNLYEIPHLIRHHYSGFISDYPQELKRFCSQLLEDINLARLISKNARAEAIKHFGKQHIAAQWKAYLGE